MRAVKAHPITMFQAYLRKLTFYKLIPVSGILLVLGMFWPAAHAVEKPVQKFFYTWQIGDWKLNLEAFSTDPELADSKSKEIHKKLLERYGQLRQLQVALKQADLKAVAIRDGDYDLLNALKTLCSDSQGTFDPSDQALRNLWGFYPESLNYHLPSEVEIQEVKTHVGCQYLEISSVPQEIYLARSGMSLNWNAFAPGWLIEQASPLLAGLPAAHLSSKQVSYYHGQPPDAPAWKVAIPNPREPETTMHYLYLKNQALSIVGNYQDYFSHGGIRYSSLLDPRTGWPNQETLVTYAVSPDALKAQALAYAISLLDDPASKELLKKYPASIYKIVERNGLLLPLSY